MAMKFFAVVAVFCAVSVSGQGMGGPMATYMGSMDGVKSFIGGKPDYELTWDNANHYCQSQNMRLPSPPTAAESKFLGNYMNPMMAMMGFETAPGFWTSSKNAARNLCQFTTYNRRAGKTTLASATRDCNIPMEAVVCVSEI